ncbi:MAG: BTAD domain-containing putative transcriptional regulator [Chloroflexaceae bacterium]
MARLNLNLLGGVALEVDGRPAHFTRRTGLALLIYLACSGRPQPRATLAALIAGESDEPKAAMAVSNALRDLRAVLGDDLQTDKQTVALAPSLTIVLDVAAFEAAARLALQQHDMAALRAAAAAYGGEFARGFVLRDAPAFDDWLHYERERLHNQYIRVLEQLADAEARAGDLHAAIVTTRRLIAEEPWREEAHRGLMRLLARDGQRAAALQQFARCRDLLRREFGTEPQPETLQLYEQLQAGPVAPPHNLPARTTAFIDRPAERALLTTVLQQPGCRVVTIVGIGGSGKTRLALEVAAGFTRPALPDELAFPDGVFPVTCDEADRASSGEVQHLAHVVLSSIKVMVEPGADPQIVLLRWLAARRLLLIIDNAEVEPAVASLVSAILAVAPDVRVLVTSRVRLRLTAECVFELGGLSLPDGPEDLPGSGAGQLFLKRARAARLQNPPGVDDYPHIVRICRLVNGLPLAIILAAGHLRALDYPEIADALAHNLHLLVSDEADMPARQRSLEVVIRWSWSRLAPEEARVLRCLSIFPGTFDRAAARAVGACTSAVLAALTDSGLLTRAGDRAYALHPLVRHIAAEELAQDPDEQAQARLRHASHFTGFASTAVERAERDVTAIYDLIDCWSDLNIAWGWAVAQSNREFIARLRPGMGQLWYALGMFQEGCTQLERAVTALGGTGAPSTWGTADRLEIIELLLAAAWLCVHQGNADQALAAMEQARGLAPGDEALVARIDQLQGTQFYLRTRYRAARPLLERALATAIRRQDGQRELAIRSLLARLAWRGGDIELMRATVVATRTRFDQREPSLDMILLWYAEAHLAAETGDLAPARALLEQRSVREKTPEHFQLRFWHWSLQTVVATAEGRLADADEHIRQAARYADAAVHGFISVHAMVISGDTLLAQGALEEADTIFVQALHVATQMDMPRPQCVALLGRGRCAELRGDMVRAHALATEALRIACDEAYQRLQPKAHMLLGHSLADLRRHTEAATAFARARAANEGVGHYVLAAEAAAAEAQILHLQGDLRAARQCLEPYLPLLLGGQLIGAEEPVRTLRGAAEVLWAADDPRGAQLHARARSELEWRAALVPPRRREDFLRAIPAHRGLLRAAESVAD